MPVSALSGTGSTTGTTPALADKDKSGFNGLTSGDFMKLLITQLKNQDPTQPMGNDELLQQLSTMRNLQANVELSSTLKSFSQNQQISSAAAFLGKIITGTNANKQEIAGVADRVFTRDGQTILGIGKEEISLSQVTGVSLPTSQGA